MKPWAPNAKPCGPNAKLCAPTASQWNILGGGSPGVVHVDFTLLVSTSFALGSQHERNFMWNMSLTRPFSEILYPALIKGTYQAAKWSNESKYSKLKNLKRYNQSGQVKYVVKYKVRKMVKCLLKHHCYCPKLLMRTTKTAVCLQTKAIFYHLNVFKLVF